MQEESLSAKLQTNLVGYLELWRESLILPFVFCLFELIFKLSTTSGTPLHYVLSSLFALSCGCIFELILSLVKNLEIRRWLRVAILAVVGLIFIIEYFVYVQFKVYYDTVTVVAGAGGVATGFADQAFELVFSPTGFLRVLFFLSPVLSYALWIREQIFDFAGKMGSTHDANTDLAHVRVPRLEVAQVALVSYLLAWLVFCRVPSTLDTYTSRYSFHEAVTSFGLLTGIRKDIQQLMGIGRASLVVEDAEVLPAIDFQVEGDQEPVVLDIDFEALAQTTEGTWADLDRYVASQSPSYTNEMTGRFKGYNLIFISAEAFSAEAIRPDTTPTLWRMANQGIQFTNYYQFDNAGTTGGECANIFGLLATEGGTSVKITATHNNYLCMGSALDREGYDGWAFHNNTYTYYDRDKTHNNLGYNHGYMGYGNGMEEWVEWQWPQSDLEMVQGTFENLYGSYGDEEHPFNIYYMSVSGHSEYDPGANKMATKNWDYVDELELSDRVKGYLAANIELDHAMEWLIAALEEKGIADRTVIVIAADHFPYGLDDDGPLGSLPYLSELYGYEVDDYFDRDHNRLILWCGSLEDEELIAIDDPVSSIDVLPTLLNLFGCEWDSRMLPGRDVFSNTEPLVFDFAYDWRTNLGTYYAGSGNFVPFDENATIPDGYVEAHNRIVANKMLYCRGVLTSDYYAHVFGEKPEEA